MIRRSRTARKISRSRAMFWEMGSTAIESHTDDALLDGLLPLEEVPQELRALALLLDEARPQPAAGPLAGEAATVDAMLAAIARGPVAIAGHRGRRMLGKTSVRAGIAAAALVLSASGAAAANGSLPAPAQRAVASALERVGVHVPNPDDSDQKDHPQGGVTGPGRGSNSTPGTASTSAPPDAATFGLCTASEAGGSPPPVDCTSVTKPGRGESVPPGSPGSTGPPTSAGPPDSTPPSSATPNPPGPPPGRGTPAPQASPKADAATASHGPPSTPPGRAR